MSGRMGVIAMATVMIGGKWRIRGDVYSWLVEKYEGKRGPKTKREFAARRKGVQAEFDKWVTVSYHPTLENAAERLRQRLLRVCEANGMQAVEVEDAQIRREIEDVIRRAREIAA